MANRRRNSQEPSNSGGSDAAPRPSILQRYSDVLMIAPALVVGVALAALFFRPSSFLSAVQKTEWRNYIEPPAAGAVLMHRGRESLIRSVREQLNRGSLARQRDSLHGMLSEIIDSQSGPVDASSALNAKALDPHNNLTALVSAMLIVAPEETGPDWQALSGPAARERFFKLSTILELAPPTDVSSTYYGTIRSVLYSVYRGYFSRPDVAMAVADAEGPFLIRSHMQALPILQARINALASALQADGAVREAEQTRIWLRRVLLELLAGDEDVTTRLLCADLLARDLTGSQTASDALNNLRDTFVDRAAAAPMDRMDPSGARTVVAPDAYSRVLASMMAAGALALMAAGAALAWLIAVCLSPFVRNQVEAAAPDKTARVGPLIVSIALTLICTAVLVMAAYPRGPYSDHWTVQMIILCAVIGFNAAVGLACAYDRPGDRPRMFRLSPIISLAPAVLVFAPPTVVVQLSRWFDGWISPLWGGLAVGAAMALTAVMLNARHLSGIRRSAAAVCCMSVALALATYALHFAADSTWADAAVPGRLDEFGARLGSDWRQERLGPVRRAVMGEGS